MIENGEFLQKNLAALADVNPELYSRLSVICQTGRVDLTNFYTFSKSRNGDVVPVIRTQPLHSMIDPKREALRLVSVIGQNSGFLIYLGLGGGFLPEAALEQTDAVVTVIDYSLEGAAELLSNKDYTNLLRNSRFSLLIDPSSEEIINFITENYKPALSGGIQTIPLRARVETDKSLFDPVIMAVQKAIDIVSGDYTVQAHFGRRWFSNIIRNIKHLTPGNEQLIMNKKPALEAAITAAGPSLDMQMQSLAEFKARNGFIISTDTALPALAHNGIIPDIAVTIDCQHISYYHFLSCPVQGTAGVQGTAVPLIMDIASPPLLSRIKGFSPIFFSGGHPLARYISNTWQPLPLLDTSGANVTYACLSIAEFLGADRITLYGADFSYVNSQTYARGTYIYPYFHKRQNRLSTLEALFSRFLYRSPFLPPEEDKDNSEISEKKNYRETSSLRFYRKKLEEKASEMNAEIISAKGMGAPVIINKKQRIKEQRTESKSYRSKLSCQEFLECYRNDIASLPAAESKSNYIKNLSVKDRQIFTTLLPSMAAIKKQNHELKLKDLIEEVKKRSIAEIEKNA